MKQFFARHKNMILIGITILVCVSLLVGIYILNKRKSNLVSSADDDLSGSGGSGTPGADSSQPWPLKRGSTGNYVKLLQSKLNKRIANAKIASITYILPEGSNGEYIKFNLPLSVDGIFGQKTEAVLYYFTKQRTITVADFNAL